MTPTPTASHRTINLARFDTLTDALDFASDGVTGVNLYAANGALLEALTWGMLRDQSRALAMRLLASGLAPGDRVALVAETDMDFVRAFFGCLYAGLIPAPIAPPGILKGEEDYVLQVRRMLVSGSVSAVFGPAPLAAQLQAAGEPLGVKVAGYVGDLPDGHAELPTIDTDQPCNLQFSSGSTRQPAGIVITHRAVMANIRAIADGLQITAADRGVNWLPLHHDMGLIGFLLAPAAQGSIDLLPTKAFVRRPLVWLELISRNGGTTSYSPSFGYELCAKRAETASLANLDLSTWRSAGIGGDVVRPEPLRQFAARFASVGFKESAFMASYGLAEATLALSIARTKAGLRSETVDLDTLENDGRALAANDDTARKRELVLCGAPLAGYEIKVCGPDGALVPERVVGRIYARGPSLMQGYLGNAELTAETISPDGWLDTGDLGYMADDEIVISGRAKDLIILNGRNVWPQDLEYTVETEVAGIRNGDVAAFSTSTADREDVIVLVQARALDEAGSMALIREVTSVLRARHALEASVILVGAHDLPKTSSGKMRRSQARTNYLAGAFAAPPRSGAA